MRSWSLIVRFIGIVVDSITVIESVTRMGSNKEYEFEPNQVGSHVLFSSPYELMMAAISVGKFPGKSIL